MNQRLGFIAKVLVLSAVISVAIKYALPYLSLPATPAIALLLVFSPTIILAVVLGWHLRVSKQHHANHPRN